MFWRVARANDDLPVGLADAQNLIVLQTLVALHHGRHAHSFRRARRPHFGQFLQVIPGHASLHIEFLTDPSRLGVTATIGEGPSLKVFALGHIERASEAIGDVFGLANMVWMHVGANDAQHRPTIHGIDKNVFPHLRRLCVGQPGIDNPPTAMILK